MQQRDWKVEPLQMNKIWYKRRIFRRIFQLILTIKKTLKTPNLPWILWLFTPSFFFSIKKRLSSNKKSRIIEFPKVNKTIIKQNKVWTLTNDQFKRQNAIIFTPDLEKFLTLFNLCWKNESKTDNYLVKVKNGNTRKRHEICSK